MGESVTLTILEAQGLLAGTGAPPVFPHCVVYANEKLLHKTEHADQNFQWSSSFVIGPADQQKIRIEVWDWQKFNNSDFIGQIQNLEQMIAICKSKKQGVEGWKPLVGKGASGGSIRIRIGFPGSVPLDPVPVSVLDEALAVIAQDPQRARNYIPQLAQLLQGPTELKRKEVILSSLYRLATADTANRFTIGGISGMPRMLVLILARDDYLFTDTQKLILCLVSALRSEEDNASMDRLDEIRWKFVEFGLPEIQKRLLSPDINAGYMRTVEIVRACASSTTAERLYDAVGDILLAQLAQKTAKNVEAFKKALLSLAQSSDSVSEKVLETASNMLACYLHGRPYLPSQAIGSQGVRRGGLGQFACQFPGCNANFANQKSLQAHVATHKAPQQKVIHIADPLELASLISSVEKPNAKLSCAVDKWLGTELVFLPNRTHKLWQSEITDPPEPPGANDVMTLSMLFAGILPAEVLKQLTYEQVYFYMIFALRAQKQKKETIVALQNMCNRTQSLAQHVYFQNKVNPGFATLSPINVWRLSCPIERTISWLDETFVIPAGGARAKFQPGKQWDDLDIVDPLGFIKGAVTSVALVKIFASATKPMLIRMNPMSDHSTLMIFKRGDDLRQDFAIQTMFFIFNRLWAQSSMPDKAFIHQYKIVPMGAKIGVLEFVTGCISSGEYDWRNLNSELPGPTQLTPQEKYTFILSMAGSYIACWILGIRDRHQDNMQIKDGKIFFHIDFGFILNESPNLDAPIFSIPRGVKRHLSPNEWNFFLKVCGDAFIVLHQNYDIVMKSCVEAMSSITSVEKIRKYLSTALMVGLSEAAAKHQIRLKVIEGSNSAQKEVKYLVHSLAVQINN